MEGLACGWVDFLDPPCGPAEPAALPLQYWVNPCAKLVAASPLVPRLPLRPRPRPLRNTAEREPSKMREQPMQREQWEQWHTKAATALLTQQCRWLKVDCANDDGWWPRHSTATKAAAGCNGNSNSGSSRAWQSPQRCSEHLSGARTTATDTCQPACAEDANPG